MGVLPTGEAALNRSVSMKMEPRSGSRLISVVFGAKDDELGPGNDGKHGPDSAIARDIKSGPARRTSSRDQIVAYVAFGVNLHT